MADTVGVAAGTIIKMADDTGVTFVTLGEVIELGDLVFEAANVQATRLSSKTHEYVSGVADTPETDIRFRLLMDDPTQDDLTGVHKVFNDREKRKYQIKLPGMAKGIEFEAVPTRHGIAGLRPEDLMTRVLGLKLSGDMMVKAIT